MLVNEAKDFIVQQTSEQAQREGLALSDLERRMMYFTESEDAVENPIALNKEFEAQYDIAEYETKIARLLIHAYRRLKEENPEGVRLWARPSENFVKETTTFLLCGVSGLP